MGQLARTRLWLQTEGQARSGGEEGPQDSGCGKVANCSRDVQGGSRADPQLNANTPHLHSFVRKVRTVSAPTCQILRDHGFPRPETRWHC